MTKEQFTHLEEKLRESILQTGLSLNEIARRSSVSQPILSRFVRGERSLTLPIAGKLCEMLGLRLCGHEEAQTTALADEVGKAPRPAGPSKRPTDVAEGKPAKGSKGKRKK